MRCLPTLAVLLSLLLAGCVQGEEELALELDGTGTYDLDLTWDAALVRQLVDLVGPECAARFQGRALPLTEAAWRRTLEGVEGVRLETVSVTLEDDGRRHLRIRLAFDRLTSLLGWELFARRRLRVGPRAPDGEEASTEIEFVQDPLARVPLLDALADALGHRERPPTPEGGRFALLDPEPLERLGLSTAQADLAARMLAPHLDRVRLAFRVRAPRTVHDARMAAFDVRAQGREGFYRWSFEDLARYDDRALRFAWTPRAGDDVPEIDHPGDVPEPERTAGHGSGADDSR